MLQYQTTQNFLKVYSEHKSLFLTQSYIHHRWTGVSAQCNSSETQADAGSLYIRTSTVTETRERKYGKPGTDSLKLYPEESNVTLHTFNWSKQNTWSQLHPPYRKGCQIWVTSDIFYHISVLYCTN